MRVLQKKRVAKVWVSRPSIEAMFREADRSYPCETGGVLMGYWTGRGADSVVTRVVGPGPHAMHDETCFVPDGEFHEMEIARIYEESGRIYTYLGDWHSHPTSAAYLSELDRVTLKRIATHTAARAPSPLMVVLGGGPPWDVKVWTYMPRLFFGLRRTRVESMRLQIY